MDYDRGEVIDYLHANRSVFINSEYCIEVTKGPDGLRVRMAIIEQIDLDDIFSLLIDQVVAACPEGTNCSFSKDIEHFRQQRGTES